MVAALALAPLEASDVASQQRDVDDAVDDVDDDDEEKVLDDVGIVGDVERVNVDDVDDKLRQRGIADVGALEPGFEWKTCYVFILF